MRTVTGPSNRLPGDASCRPASEGRRAPPVLASAPMNPPNLHVSDHPAVLHKLGILRDVATEPKKFREVVRELSWLLGYEALADVGVRPLDIRTPMEPMTAHQLDERIGLVPIRRGFAAEYADDEVFMVTSPV